LTYRFGKDRALINLFNLNLVLIWEEFKKLGGKSNHEWFKELCFCLLTANSSAELGIKIQKNVGDGFITMNTEQLYLELQRFGHRFCRRRAEFIISARPFVDSIKDRVMSFHSGKRAREWLEQNILGLGMKESSHFLRNVGYDDVAIIDRHIINLLVEHNLISRPKTITRRKYLETEGVVEKISEETKIPMGKLDLYLWYMKTGKVLK
jgi:N-glycosylase/DNA lyase